MSDRGKQCEKLKHTANMPSICHLVSKTTTVAGLFYLTLASPAKNNGRTNVFDIQDQSWGITSGCLRSLVFRRPSSPLRWLFCAQISPKYAAVLTATEWRRCMRTLLMLLHQQEAGTHDAFANVNSAWAEFFVCGTPRPCS